MFLVVLCFKSKSIGYFHDWEEFFFIFSFWSEFVPIQFWLIYLQDHLLLCLKTGMCIFLNKMQIEIPAKSSLREGPGSESHVFEWNFQI